MKHMLIFAALALTGCATAGTSPPVIRYVPQTVYVEKHSPCPDPADIPAVPRRVHDEHPQMPASTVPTPKDSADVAGWVASLKGEVAAAHERERILGGKVAELFRYADKAGGILLACSK